MPDARRVNFGLENLCWAPIVESTTTPGTYEYGTPTHQLGSRAFTMEVEQAIARLFADNRTHVTVPGTKITSGEWTSYQIDKPMWEGVFGWLENASTVLSDTETNKPIAIQFAVKTYNENGVEGYVAFIMYSVLFGGVPREMATIEDEPEGEEMVANFQASESDLALDDNGKPATIGQYPFPIGTTEAQVLAVLTGTIITPDIVFTPPTS